MSVKVDDGGDSSMPAATGDSELVARFKRRLVSPFSLVKHFMAIRPPAGSPRVFNASCVLSSTRLIAGTDVPGATGAAGLTSESAALAAIGEAIERYAAAIIPWDELILATQSQLGEGAIGMDAFALYTDDVYDTPEFPLTKWHADLPVFWRECTSLASGERCFVPAPHVYVPYLYRDEAGRSDFVSMAVSTGAACHVTRARALLVGLYECIERDAFMIVWLRRLSMPRIDWESDPILGALLEKHYARTNVKFNLFDITLDLPAPTVLCVAQGVGRLGPLAVVGCATRATLREACSKALLEGAQCVAWAHYLIDHRPGWKPTADFSNVNTFEDHVRLYLEPQMLPYLEFLLATTEVRTLPALDPAPKDDATALSELVDAMSARGLNVVATDLTTRDVADVGVVVTKVMVPGLVPLTADHRFPALASSRLVEVPETLRLQPSQSPKFNPVPHPFP